MRTKPQRKHRRLHTPPASGQKPSSNLVPRDVERMAKWSAFYLRAQLSEIERKNIEAMVLALLGPDPNAVRAVQQVIGAGQWNDQVLLSLYQPEVAQTLGAADGVVIVNGSGFPKQGQHSVGVAPQYCGRLGKIANCQEGVFLVYASAHGYTFLDRRLYLPTAWFQADQRERWEACGIPEGTRFNTEPALALEMLQGLVRSGRVPFHWVTCDEHFGENPAFFVLANNKLDTVPLKADGHIRRQQALDLRPKGVQRERVSTICLPSTKSGLFRWNC